MTLPVEQQSPIAIKRQLAGMLREVFRRAGGIPISQFLDLEVNEKGKIEAALRSGARIFELTYDPDSGNSSYKLMGGRPSARLDGYLSAIASSEENAVYPLPIDWEIREDAAKKVPNCEDGVLCGETCIDPDETCRLKPGAALSNKEQAQIKQMAVALQRGQKKAEPDSVQDKYTALTIRELQAEARDRNVYRANHLSKTQLKEQLRTLDKDPDSQERLRRTLEKRRQSRKEQDEALQQIAKTPAQAWKSLQKIAKLSGTNPQTASLLAGALLASMTVRSYQGMRDQYKSGLQESAQLAMGRADTIPLEEVSKDNVVIAVGGYASTGSRGQNIKDGLTPRDDSPAEQWFGRNVDTIAFEHKEFDIPPTAASKKNADGSYSPAYLSHVATQGFGSYLQNLKRGRNDAAVDLAAQLYAYGKRNKGANLSVLSHGSGGNVTNEAVEILARMKPSDGKGVQGRDIAKRLNVINLGAPHFGFANDRIWKDVNHRTITSSNDPFSILPKRAAQWISSVPGHEVADYLTNPEVRDRIRESFGYYTSSIRGQERRERLWKERSKSIGSTLDKVGAKAAAKTWRVFNAVADKWKEDPVTGTLEAVGAASLLTKGLYMAGNDRLNRSLPREAANAYAMSKDMGRTVPSVQGKEGYLLTVGGTGVPADQLRKQLIDATKDPTTGKSWYEDSQVAIAYDPNGRVDIPDLVKGKGMATDAWIASQGFGSAARQMLTAESDPDAARLAAMMYAAAEKGDATGAPVNVVAYDTGGMTARRAVEILSKMGPEGSNKGVQYARRVRLATLGSPDFGLSRTGTPQGQLNLMGAGDSFSQFPLSMVNARNPEIMSGVAYHSSEEYIRSPEVQERLKGFFGAGTIANPQTTNAAPPAASASPTQGAPQASAPDIDQAVKRLKLPDTPVPGTGDPRLQRRGRTWESLSPQEKVLALEEYAAARQATPAPSPPVEGRGSSAERLSARRRGDPRERPGWNSLSPEQQIRELDRFVQSQRGEAAAESPPQRTRRQAGDLEGLASRRAIDLGVAVRELGLPEEPSPRSADPRLTPGFEDLPVEEQASRLLNYAQRKRQKIPSETIDRIRETFGLLPEKPKPTKKKKPKVEPEIRDAIARLNLPAAPAEDSGDPRLKQGWESLTPEQKVRELEKFARRQGG